MRIKIFTIATILMAGIAMVVAFLCEATTISTVDTVNVAVVDTNTAIANKPVLVSHTDTIETVTIGNRIWTKKNLDIVVDSSWCYDNDTANCEKYGRLYSWDAAVKVCPMLGDGWRLPDSVDWLKLVAATAISKLNEIMLGDNSAIALRAKTGWERMPPSVLKSKDGRIISSRESGLPYYPATDSLGFSALPGGGRSSDDGLRYYFYGIGHQGWWWGITKRGNTALSYVMKSYLSYVGDKHNDSDTIYERDAHSVRCVRDVR